MSLSSTNEAQTCFLSMCLLGRVFFVHSRHVLLMIYPHFQGFLRCIETNMRNKKGYIKFNDNAIRNRGKLFKVVLGI